MPLFFTYHFAVEENSDSCLFGSLYTIEEKHTWYKKGTRRFMQTLEEKSRLFKIY